MTMKTSAALFAALTIGVAPVSAQVDHAQHHPQDQQAMEAAQHMDMNSMMGMMMGGPAALLRAADDLGLSDAQRASLTELQERFVSERTSAMETMHAAMATASAAAREVLTTEQLDVFTAPMGQMGQMGQMDMMQSMMNGSMDVSNMKMDEMQSMMQGMMQMMNMCHGMMGGDQEGHEAHGGR